MFARSTLTVLSLAVAILGLSSCQQSCPSVSSIAIAEKSCHEDPKAPGKCLNGTKLAIDPYIAVWGMETTDYYVEGADPPDQTQGTVGAFGNNGDPPAYTDKYGRLVVPNGMAPAYWNFNWLSPWRCSTDENPADGPVSAGMPINIDYQIGPYSGPFYPMEVMTYYTKELVPNYLDTKRPYELVCFVPGPWITPASTRFAIAGGFPSTLTLSTRAPATLLTQFGMPLLYVYDKDGNIVSTLVATNVDSSGTQATFPFPSSLPQGGYSLAVVNRTGGGVGFSPAGGNLLSIASSQTISGNPFGVAVGGQNFSVKLCTRLLINGRWQLSCNTSSHYQTFPIVSLYSQGQVLIGSNPVAVGSNPTAVAVYPAPDEVSTTTSDDQQVTTTVSGSMRAIVANSESNTVTILDLVQNAPAFTVTVGNQPVALAVSADGSTAYVANYGDSTVTRVNLLTGTPTATVAAGGQPTSVALTSAGVLWVGGPGFLTEVNASGMNVVATESIRSSALPISPCRIRTRCSRCRFPV